MTNSAAIGYMIITARAAGLDEETIKFLASEMNWKMDENTENEAEEVYWNS